MEEVNTLSPRKPTTTNTLQSRMSHTHTIRASTTTMTIISLYCNQITHMGQIRIHLDLDSQAPMKALNQLHLPVRRQSDGGKL